tara:strand:- start:704 stop:847 length:144 start_codon:yes stop_codon:yes gene_type:complete
MTDNNIDIFLDKFVSLKIRKNTKKNDVMKINSDIMKLTGPINLNNRA